MIYDSPCQNEGVNRVCFQSRGEDGRGAEVYCVQRERDEDHDQTAGPWYGPTNADGV